MERLHGLDKLLMKILRSSLQSSMAKKETPDDAQKAMLRVLNEGGSFVSEAHLSGMLDWIQKEQKHKG